MSPERWPAREDPGRSQGSAAQEDPRPRSVPAFREVEAGAAAVRDATLLREGWTKRFVGASPRLEEAAALYEALGLEVRLEAPASEDLPSDCGECPVASALFRVVYTRRRR